VASFFGAEAYTEALAHSAASLEVKSQAEGWASHAELVVGRVAAAGEVERSAEGDSVNGDHGSSGTGAQALAAAGGGSAAAPSGAGAIAALEAFVKGWRRHFLDSMRPRHLPAFWSVDARVANSSGAANNGGSGGGACPPLVDAVAGCSDGVPGGDGHAADESGSGGRGCPLKSIEASGMMRNGGFVVPNGVAMVAVEGDATGTRQQDALSLSASPDCVQTVSDDSALCNATA
jgi:hypothetical protein